jgi:KamA family protein
MASLFMNTFHTQSELNRLFSSLAIEKHLLAVKVTPFFQQKINEEVAALAHHEGPLHRMAYPSQERLFVTDGKEVPDFVEDKSNMPVNARIIHKYPDRILFLATDNCAGHCQYCFRQDLLSDKRGNGLSTQEDLAQLITYLKEHPEVSEVILSGGDPLTLPLAKLRNLLEALLAEPQLNSIRIHSKMLTYAPHVFQQEAKLQALAYPKIRLVFHITHPYEICTVVEETLKKIQSYGIKCYNQFPILRNINDHPLLLKKFLVRLDELNIRNLSIFLPEPVLHSTAYRIRLSRLFTIMDEVQWTSPSWVNSTRFALDSPVGKVRRENLVDYDSQKNEAIFVRGKESVVYPDLPKTLDIPGKIELLLWKDYL